MFSLHPSLDVERLNAQFAADGRLQCPDFLEHSAAELLHGYLKHDMEWSIVLAEAERFWEAPPEVRREMHEQQEMELAARAYETAKQGFSCYYERNRYKPCGSDSCAPPDASEPEALRELLSFLNSERSLEFFRYVTTIPISNANAQATRFRPGHFLTFHSDGPGSRRQVAYVINLTPNWNPSWGGLLQFMSPGGEIVQTFVPKFNTLHLFKIPQLHAVSFVSPFAQHSRYAISGWLHVD